MEVLPLFSTPLALDFVNYTFNKDLIDSLEYKEYDNGVGYMSNNKILLEESFSDLRIQIEEKINLYLSNILQFEEGKIKHACSWLSIQGPKKSAEMHIHANSCYSGVVYLKYPPNSGKIWFSHPLQIPTFGTSTISPSISKFNVFNSKRYFIEPKDNLLLLFPSHVDHYTEVNETLENRYALSFNYFIVGEFGEKTTELTL